MSPGPTRPRIRSAAPFFPVSVALLLLAGCQPHPFPQYPSNYREYAYVTNGGSGTVTIIDVVNVRVDREIAVGQHPVAVASSPTRNEVYVVNSGVTGGTGSLSVIDAERNAVAATIPLHRDPVSIAVDGAGKLGYIANAGSNSVSVIDLKMRREVALLGAGEQPDAAAISPDDKTLVVANRGGNSVSIFDAQTGKLRAVFDGCPGAGQPVILSNSSKTFVPCMSGHQVMVIGLARPGNRPNESDRLETFMDVGRAPANLALKPDSGELFVSNAASDTISEVVTSTDDVDGAYMMGDEPVYGLVSSDNSLLYVANRGSQYLTIYSINDGRRIGSVRVGDGPTALAFSANGYLLFAVDARSGDVAVVRTALRSLFTLLPAGRDPNAIVDKAFTVK